MAHLQSVGLSMNDDASRATRLAAAPKGWKPIETAPKDGSSVILTNGDTVAQGWWLDVEGYIRERRDVDGNYIDQDEFDGFTGWMDFGGGMLPEPTHWMPLPPAPDAAPAASSPEAAAMLVPLSDDGKSVFIDGFGEVPLAYPASSPEAADERASAARDELIAVLEWALLRIRTSLDTGDRYEYAMSVLESAKRSR